MNLDALLRIKARVSGIGEVRSLQDSLSGVEDAARSAAKEIKETREASSNWKSSVLGITAMGAALVAGSKAAIDFESSMADVRKVVSGLDTPQGMADIKKEILDLTSVMPITAQGFTEIYAAAGASGIARNELREFSVLVAKVSTAFDMTAADAGAALSRLKVSLGLTTKEVESLADSMNYLSDTTGASAAGLVEFMTRSGATGKIAGLSAQETIAFGAAMQQTGIETEVAATSFNNMIKALSAGSSMTERQVSALNALGYAYRPAVIAERDLSEEVEKQSRLRLQMAQDETEKLSREIDRRYRKIKQQLQDQWDDERDAKESALEEAADNERKALQRNQSKQRKQISDYYQDRQDDEEKAVRARYESAGRVASQEGKRILQEQMQDELTAIRRRYRDIEEEELQKLEDLYQSKEKKIETANQAILKAERRAARDREQIALDAIEARENAEQNSLKRQYSAIEEGERQKIEVAKKEQSKIEEQQKKQAEAAADAWKLGFSERLQKDGAKFILEILSRISNLPKAQQTSVLRNLFGDEARGLPSLIGNIKELERVLKAATDEQAYSGSVAREYGIRAETTANQISLLVNDVYRLRVAIGEALKPTIDALLPVLRFFVGGLAGLAQALSDVINHFARVSVFGKILTPLVTSVIGIGSAISGVFSFAVLARWASGLKILSILPRPLRLITAALTILGLAASPLGRIINAAVLAITAFQAIKFGANLITAIKGISLGFRGLPVALRVALAAMKTAFTGFVTFLTTAILPGVIAFFSGPAGWITLAIAAVAAMAIIFRKPIGDFLKWLGKALPEGFAAAWETVKKGTTEAVKWLGERWTEISQSFQSSVVTPIGKAWNNLLQAIPNALSTMAGAVVGIWQGVVSAIRGALNTVIQAVNSAVSGALAQINRVINALNNLTSRVGAPSLPRMTVPEIPQFATGGYVTRPTLAMIGEGGEPEYVVPRSKVQSFAAAVSSGVSGERALANKRPSWREIALETLANDPSRYMSAASAIMTGWRKQGVLQTAANEPILRKRALESLGFRLGPGADWGGGGFTVKRYPSLTGIRRELESLRNGRSGSSGSGITLNTRIDRVIRQEGEDRVTLAQAQALASDAARQAVAEMNRNLTRPSFRQSRGLRG